MGAWQSPVPQGEADPLSSNGLPDIQSIFPEMKWPRKQSHLGGFAGLMSVIQQAQGGLQSIRSLRVVGGRMCTVLALDLSGTF